MSSKPNEKRRRLLDGVKFSVDAVEWTGPGGTIKRELVVHPGAVVILPLLENDRVVMIRNFRFSVGRRLWELAAGTLERGEEPELCARRELIEETGYRAASVAPLCRFYASPGICDELMHVFVATDLTPVGQALEDAEDIEVEVLPLTEAYCMTADGRIEDGKTLAALLYYRCFASQ